MSTLFNVEANQGAAVPVTVLMYRDMAPGTGANSATAKQGEAAAEVEHANDAAAGPSPQEVDDLVNRARAEASAETERRLRIEYEAKLKEEAAKIRRALELFQDERREYFARVESEVVHLALAISAKILHREAQVDPMLVAALVRVAVDKLHDGSSVSVRVAPSEAAKWREYLANPLNGSTVQILEDDHLDSAACILETDLGSANFSIDAQLKEVEQGFFDLLAQRPAIK
jgi:flagellar assembly protein FliH